jgi:hypothetical protein
MRPRIILVWTVEFRGRSGGRARNPLNFSTPQAKVPVGPHRQNANRQGKGNILLLRAPPIRVPMAMSSVDELGGLAHFHVLVV